MCNLQSLLRRNHVRLLRSHDDEVDNDDALGHSTRMGVGVEPSSACLWAMVTDFLEVDYTCKDQIMSREPGVFLCNTAGSADASSRACATLKRAIQELESILGETSALQDSVEVKIGSCVAKALKFKSFVGGAESTHYIEQAQLPAVLRHLRRQGYNAGLCVTARKPGDAAGLPPTGGHRYIDVILEEVGISQLSTGKRPSEKLIVDVGFPAHFEIARPLPAYQKLIALLPSTFIGKSALLQRVVHIMSQAARVSLESQGMPIPPWRCFSFLLAKWLSPCCSRITSVNKGTHIATSSTSSTGNRIKPHVLAELDYNTGLACNLAALPAVNNDNCEKYTPAFSLFSQKGVAKPWHPPPAIALASHTLDRQNTDDDDASISSYKRRSQAKVVSALALAFAETQLIAHNVGVAAD